MVTLRAISRIGLFIVYIGIMAAGRQKSSVHGPGERRRPAPGARSEIVVVVCLLPPPACGLLLPPAAVCVGGVGRVALLRGVGDLGDDVVEEVELFVVGDGLLEVESVDAFRVARLGLGGGFSDERDHEELEGFGWMARQQGRAGQSRARRESRTDHDGRHLGYLADIVVGLHDALDARDGEVVLDGDVVYVGGQRRVGRPACRAGRVWHVVCVVHAFHERRLLHRWTSGCGAAQKAGR
jgi:hypothetical protein